MKIKHILIFVLAVTGLSFGQTRIVNQYVSQYNRQSTSPGNPPSNTGYLYLSSSGVLTCTNSDGSSCLSAGGGAPTGAAGGDLGGTYPNPTVSKITSSTSVTTTALTATSYATASNCGAVGSAASPSVAACGAASAGAFSCATNASAATCTINTSAVTANSQILVWEVADESTRLSVTCNAAPSVVPAILVASKSSGVSFTINMPTITVSPACFDFIVVN